MITSTVHKPTTNRKFNFAFKITVTGNFPPGQTHMIPREKKKLLQVTFIKSCLAKLHRFNLALSDPFAYLLYPPLDGGVRRCQWPLVTRPAPGTSSVIYILNAIQLTLLTPSTPSSFTSSRNEFGIFQCCTQGRETCRHRCLDEGS